MLKVGLTGGIGCGKSEVSNFFKSWDSYIFDADKEAKDIINNNKIAQEEIIKEFGSDVINSNNIIDKSKLARIAFQNEFHQLKLNSIIHPYVFKKIDETFNKIKTLDKYKIFILDAALIYESGADTHLDYIIVVSSLLRFRTERVMKRGNISREDFMKRLALQWPDEDKVHMADFVIHNNGSKEDLLHESKNIYKRLG